MKKVWTFFLSMAFVLSLAACGGTAASSGGSASSEPAASAFASSAQPAASSEAAEPSADAASSAEPETPAGEGGTLVAYFSWSGNTQQMAQVIAEQTGGDLFEFTPADPYTVDDLNWTDENSRVVYEYENPDERDTELAADTPDGWEDYDVVFLGYPIWWYDAAWPVDGFVEANDFTGKTVIPFCTSSSSGLGESGSRLAELADAGDWLEGQRFPSSASQADVEAWVDGLGL